MIQMEYFCIIRIFKKFKFQKVENLKFWNSYIFKISMIQRYWRHPETLKFTHRSRDTEILNTEIRRYWWTPNKVYDLNFSRPRIRFSFGLTAEGVVSVWDGGKYWKEFSLRLSFSFFSDFLAFRSVFGALKWPEN